MKYRQKRKVKGSMLHPSDFFDLSDELVASLFSGCEYAWQALAQIGQHIVRLVGQESTILGEVMDYVHIGDKPIYIAEGARIEPGACILGPAYIGPDAVVRQGAYIRENVILLSGSILGHASEAKNSMFLPNSHAPHFSYIGDSILGHRVNLGAGTKLSNLTIVSEKDPDTGKRPSLKITINGVDYDTQLPKIGAILGDDVQTGCNSVLNPGCLVGPRTLVYANVSLRKGYYSSDSMIKLQQEVTIVPRT
jgi:NDP-sugar pyrophosphorylase family protein